MKNNFLHDHNNLVTEHHIQQESKICENIFEILAHLAVFNPLITCIFPDVASLGAATYIAILPDKSSREHYINLHIKEIVKYFQKKENVKKFAQEVEKFYLEHKKALDKAGINNSHKNAYSMAIATIRAVADMQNKTKTKTNKTSSNLTQIPSINSQVIAKFYEIFNEYKKYDIVGDIEGNLIDINGKNEGAVRNFSGGDIIRIGGKCINPETRSSILLKYGI